MVCNRRSLLTLLRSNRLLPAGAGSVPVRGQGRRREQAGQGKRAAAGGAAWCTLLLISKGQGLNERRCKANVLLQVGREQNTAACGKDGRAQPWIERTGARHAFVFYAPNLSRCLQVSICRRVAANFACPSHTPLASAQAYISRARVDSFSLTADLMYVSQVGGMFCLMAALLCLAARKR